MSPKIATTREGIAQAAFDIAREEGYEALTVRRIAAQLGCSTQPLLYHYQSIDEIRCAVYDLADQYHSSYITDLKGDYDIPLLEVGMRYLRFGHEEKNLFRLLFQTNQHYDRDILALNDDERLAPVIDMLEQETDLDRDQAKLVFTSLAVMAHGYASLMANNAMPFNEQAAQQLLLNAFMGAMSQHSA